MILEFVTGVLSRETRPDESHHDDLFIRKRKRKDTSPAGDEVRHKDTSITSAIRPVQVSVPGGDEIVPKRRKVEIRVRTVGNLRGRILARVETPNPNLLKKLHFCSKITNVLPFQRSGLRSAEKSSKKSSERSKRKKVLNALRSSISKTPPTPTPKQSIKVERRCPYCHYSMYVRKAVLDHISSQHKCDVRADGGMDTTLYRITNLSRAGVWVVSRDRLAKGLKLVNCPNDIRPLVLEYSKTILAEALVLVGDETEPNRNKHYVCRGLLRRARGGQVRRRTAHLFPPELWNCYVRTLAGLPRTTNTCEAWHRRLTSLVGKHHPSFFVFLGQLRKEVAEIDIHITRAEGGYSPTKRESRLEQAEQRIHRIVDRYHEYKNADDVVTYLRAIGHNLSGYF
ncbi:UPF0248 protein [Frankliniella fusca]|uniref:UPF0248 protein n=1 Tax=Frankliniella fusca TaxID=407009 RepID=A0AAE1HZ31_9NEOP|nr:UPF0248 protein [Frankliniella fusca]